MITPAHASDEQIAGLLDIESPRKLVVTQFRHPSPLPREEYLGMSRRDWIEHNAHRIWDLLRKGNRRDVTFNDLARSLWEKL